MSDTTRRIGLSLGADICWPICYEGILEELDLALPIEDETVRFEVERVTIRPFMLRQPVRYDLVIDRLTRWFHVSREWIKKAVLMNDLYVFNNPWSIQSMEKHTTYCAMMQLGMPVPETMLIPPKAYVGQPDLQVTLERYARHFSFEEIGERVGFPLFLKPYDGGAWVGVEKADDVEQLKAAYEGSGTSVMHAQKGVVPYDNFVRCIGVGPQTKLVSYDPSAPLHERYEPDLDIVASGRITAKDAQLIRDTTLTINAFFGWDFNSCELIQKDSVWHPFDFANPCPDAQVTSLHVHFPWIVTSQIRWSLFCAATRRPMRRTLDWGPFYEIAASKAPYAKKLKGYAAIAAERFDTGRFEEFCDNHLANLDEVAREFFGTDKAKNAVRKKVEAIFPQHEWDQFSEHFWQKIQDWREAGI